MQGEGWAPRSLVCPGAGTNDTGDTLQGTSHFKKTFLRKASERGLRLGKLFCTSCAPGVGGDQLQKSEPQKHMEKSEEQFCLLGMGRWWGGEERDV